MEQAGIEHPIFVFLAPTERLQNFDCHDAHALAVVDVVNADEIQRIGKGMNDAAEIDE